MSTSGNDATDAVYNERNKLREQLKAVRDAVKSHDEVAKRIQNMNMSSAVATAALALNACLDTIDAVKAAVKDD